MRKATELSANLRGFARSTAPGSIWDEESQKMVPTALAALAVAEVRFMFLLVKLSGAEWKDEQHEPVDQTRSATVP